ncbi:hypothetical protein [Zobellella sp. An-6]|uniref:hypothetical protein n=1 Tax=Zobellella sp. An-6 TaxID=3400218 RepID=UPI004041F439
MIFRADSKYPIHRAYVVKLSSDATPDALCGRLENLVSGKQGDFASAHELFELMTADLGSGERASPEEP